MFRPCKGLGTAGKGRGAFHGQAGDGGRGRERAGKQDHRTIATKFGQDTVARIINAPNGRIGNSRFMGRVFRSSKTTIGKTKQPSPVILKEVPGKGTKPAIVARLPARERETLLAIARVLAGK